MRKKTKKKNYKFFYHIQKLEVCHSASFTAPWGREFAVASATNENPVYINARERELPISKKITPYGSTNKNVKSWEPTSRIMDFHKKKACSYRWCFLNIGTLAYFSFSIRLRSQIIFSQWMSLSMFSFIGFPYLPWSIQPISFH